MRSASALGLRCIWRQCWNI
ncbi:hypothetical protein FQN60_000156 [Etheostoma spectabile]|uniref:Uncharacterized protein n=1 Tax=Etheostoma spectabile TaxID=54343 RepID=A0A5J5D0A3_9PERO|nr:hypothetical protein FQN60_000156 [Etheostoma spectabile]